MKIGKIAYSPVGRISCGKIFIAIKTSNAISC